MLSDLCIRNFTTVDKLELDFERGLSILTGETGAGKSVLLDALALALGGKSQKHLLRDESRPAEFCAGFQLPAGSPALQWLRERDLPEGDAPGDAGAELLCRRVLKPDGRSRAFINGSAVNIGELRELASLLVDLHGQHEHQTLLNKSSHRELLDEYGQHGALRDEIAGLASEWKQLQQRIASLLQASASGDSRAQLLAYQVGELDALELKDGEIEALEAEHRLLANAEALSGQLQTARQICDDDDSGGGLHASLRKASVLIAECATALPELANAQALFESATIQVEEAATDLASAAERVQLDPARLAEVESRLDAIHSIARKHHVRAPELFTLHETLAGELEALQNGEALANTLREQQREIEQRYNKRAQALTRKRKSAARKLEADVAARLAELQMKHCRFEISLTAREAGTLSAHGQEAIEFLISTVPGKPAQPLARIASGGELSRISLAIQVCAVQGSATPTLVFDEVDVGISGAVAEVVGNLLRELGKTSQVLCVTHLPQVAAKGNQHLLVTKQLSKQGADTRISKLDRKSRRAELARMLGGLDVTESTLAHAGEMLDTA